MAYNDLGSGYDDWMTNPSRHGYSEFVCPHQDQDDCPYNDDNIAPPPCQDCSIESDLEYDGQAGQAESRYEDRKAQDMM